MKNCSNKLKFLFLSPVFFDALWQRHQTFALKLAKLGHEVWFLQPYLSGGYGVSEIIWEKGLENFKLLRVKVPIKASSWPSLNTIATKLAMSQVVRKLDVKNTILWIAEPYMCEFVKLGFKKIIYDRCDLHGAFPGQKAAAWAKYEELLFETSDLILASHPYLLATMPSVLGKVMLVKNAVSTHYVERANLAIKDNQEINEGTKELHLLSSGAHFEWTDFQWLYNLATSSNPKVRLHIAGAGRGREFEQLLKLPNVKFHKNLNREELLSLMKKSQVGLVPFKDLPLIKGVDPIKVYEYAACGLQIWAPPVKAMECNPFITHFVRVDRGRLDFEEKEKVATEVATWIDRLNLVLEALAGLGL